VHSRILDIDGRMTNLDFGHEGVLYRQSFIMYDKQIDSKWNHSTGLAMSGKLAGRELRILPSRVMRWKNCRYPGSWSVGSKFTKTGSFITPDPRLARMQPPLPR
jgi:hypothetical protein